MQIMAICMKQLIQIFSKIKPVHKMSSVNLQRNRLKVKVGKEGKIQVKIQTLLTASVFAVLVPKNRYVSYLYHPL